MEFAILRRLRANRNAFLKNMRAGERVIA